MQVQHQIGADIMFAFDECTTLLNTREYQERSVERTQRWAERCVAEHERLTAERAEKIAAEQALRSLREQLAQTERAAREAQQAAHRAEQEAAAARAERDEQAERMGRELQILAEQAREDYARLARENRERFAARGYEADVADAHFGNYAVAKDCIEAEQMHGRWATERFASSAADYRKVEQLLEHVRQFLRCHSMNPVPRQRESTQPW